MRALIVGAIVILLSAGMLLEASVLWYEAYQEGLLALGRRDWSEAEQKLQQSIQWGPKARGKVRAKGDDSVSFLPEYYLGVIYFRQENYSKALNQFQMVDASGLILKGTPEYFEMNDLIKQAQGNIQRFKGTDDVAKLLETTKTLIDQQRYNEARLPLEEARSKDPSNPQIPYLFSMISRKENEKKDKEEEEAKKIQLNESPPPVVVHQPEAEPDPELKPAQVVTEPSRESKAIRAFYQGQYQEAITQLLAIQKESTDPAKIYFYLGCSYAGFALKTGNNKETFIHKARENFLQAWKLDPTFKYHNRFISPQIAHLYLMQK